MLMGGCLVLESFNLGRRQHVKRSNNPHIHHQFALHFVKIPPKNMMDWIKLISALGLLGFFG